MPENKKEKTTTIRAQLPESVINQRLEIKLELAKATGIPFGKINDVAFFAQAIREYHRNWFEKGEKNIPEELKTDE